MLGLAKAAKAGERVPDIKKCAGYHENTDIRKHHKILPYEKYIRGTELVKMEDIIHFAWIGQERFVKEMKCSKRCSLEE